VENDEEFRMLVRSSDYEFFMECGITKPVTSMRLGDKSMIISAVCLHYAILGSLAELEQLKRGLQTAKLATLMDKHAHLFKELFLHSHKPITADFIQDMFVTEYSDHGSNNRVKEEAIMMNWVSYLQELEGTLYICITIVCPLQTLVCVSVLHAYAWRGYCNTIMILS
jgi:hypothetical protein